MILIWVSSKRNLSLLMQDISTRSMIPEAVFREFPAETPRKHTISGRNPPQNARNSTQESGDRIRLPVLPGSCLFRAEPDKFGHWIRSPKYCFHVPSISGVFLRKPARTSRPGQTPFQEYLLVLNIIHCLPNMFFAF